jgi:hypothetical protein
MSIVRLWQSGLETGSLDEFSLTAGTPAASTAQKNTGNYSLLCNANSEYGLVTISPIRQVRVGFFFNPMTISTSTEVQILDLRESDGTQLVGIHQKGTTANSPLILDVAGTDQDTEIGANTPSTWFHLLIDVYIDSSSGWATVYKDGIEILSFSGNTGNADIEQVLFGFPSSVNGGNQYWDDMYIDNTSGEGAAQSGPILYFYSVTPNADGNYSQWLGSDGDSTNNYQLVDEIPPSDSDYVVTTGTNNLDSYNMSTFTLDTGEVIEAIIPTVRVKRTSTTEQIVLGSRLSSTDLLGVVQDPGTSFDYLFQRLTGTPAGANWQQSDLDSVELLIASTGTY